MLHPNAPNLRGGTFQCRSFSAQIFFSADLGQGRYRSGELYSCGVGSAGLLKIVVYTRIASPLTRSCNRSSFSLLAPRFVLVVPHKLVGRNFFGAWAECVPCVGQVIAPLQADP